MDNTVNNSNIFTKTNVLITGATGAIGALGGIAKSHFIDKPDVQKGLEREFQNYKKAVMQNEINIKDSFMRAAKNQELRDNFNILCDYWYNTGLKKANKKNIIIGTLIGVMAGIAGIVAKNLLRKNKGTTNETNANKVQYYNA